VTAACREHGFVETVLGRRRRLPDIHSTDPKRRRKAERQALNAVVQGSAADLVKRAMASMVASFGAKYDARRRPRLVLQLHDELVFEVPTQHLATCALDVSSALEAATALEGVPAEVRLRAGPSWAALEPYDPHSVGARNGFYSSCVKNHE
jgi:DNA polymerase-1